MVLRLLVDLLRIVIVVVVMVSMVVSGKCRHRYAQQQNTGQHGEQ